MHVFLKKNSFNTFLKSVTEPDSLAGPGLFYMLNVSEHEIYHAHLTVL